MQWSDRGKSQELCKSEYLDGFRDGDNSPRAGEDLRVGRKWGKEREFIQRSKQSEGNTPSRLVTLPGQN
jgi:hypothetical protein